MKVILIAAALFALVILLQILNVAGVLQLGLTNWQPTLYAYLAGAIDIDGRIFIRRARGYRIDREMAYYSAVCGFRRSRPGIPI